MRTPTLRWLLFFAKALPYIFLFGVGLALITTIALGHPDLAARGSYLVLPAILLFVIATRTSLLKKIPDTTLARIHLSSRYFTYLILLFILLYLISLCLVVGSESRPLSYFLLVAAMVSLIFVEILSTDQEHSGRVWLILVQMVFLSLSLIFGQTLKLPLYFGGGGDVLVHMHYVSTIVESGHVTSAMGDYLYFPLFHVLGATETMVTGMNLKTSYFLFNGLAFITSIPLVYLLARQVTKDTHLPLVAALFYSQSSVVILGGMYTVTRTVAYVLCLLVLYLLVRAKGNLTLRGIAVFLILPLILMHQSTLIIASGILVALLIGELILYHRSERVGYNYLMLFCIAYLGYWTYVAYPFFSSMVTVLAATTEPVVISSGATLQQDPLTTHLLRYMEFSIAAFLAMLGIVSKLSQSRQVASYGHVFALFALGALLFYLPGPVTLLASSLLSYRLPLPLSPFITLAMAGGSLLFVQQAATNRQGWKTMTTVGISLLIIFSFSLSSSIITANSTDLNLKVLGNEPRSYYTEAELSAFSFCAQRKRNAPIYTDYHSGRYFEGYLAMPAISTYGEVFNIKQIKKGYFLFRKEELQSRGQLQFQTKVRHGFGLETHIYRVGDAPDLESTWSEQDRIFDNNSVEIYSLKKHNSS